MSYIVHYDAAAAFLNLVALYLFYGRKNLRDKTSQRFGILLWVALGSSLFGVIGSLLINRQLPLNPLIFQVSNMAFFIFHISIPLAAAWFILAMLGRTRGGNWERFFFISPYLGGLGLILSNPWTGLIFRATSPLAYEEGPGILILYLLAIFYICYSFLFFMRKRKNLPRMVRILFPVLFGLPTIAILIQSQLAVIPLECFAVSISLLVILFTLQNSSQLIDRETGLLNRQAFIKTTQMRLGSGEGFDLFLLRSVNMDRLLSLHSSKDIFHLLRLVAAYIASKAGFAERVFSLDDGNFAIFPRDSLDKEARLSLAEEISEGMSREWSLNGTSASLQARACILRCPEDAAEVLDIFDCLEKMGLHSKASRSGTPLRAWDLQLMNSKREGEAEGAVLQAIASGRMGILYQPIFCVAEGRFTAADTQLYLDPPGKPRIVQRELIQAAERSGIMHRAGHLALKNIAGFYAAADLAAKGIEQIQLRLSALQSLRSDLPQQVLAVVEALGIDPARICFEITESAATYSPEAMSLNMRLLSAQGLSFALDDYGSGFTDLGYIMELPFKFIKLDKSVIRNGFQSEKGRIILESTIALVRRLGRKIIAEGVETAAQAQLLSSIGCDLLQGYYYAQPLEADEFLSIL